MQCRLYGLLPMNSILVYKEIIIRLQTKEQTILYVDLLDLL